MRVLLPPLLAFIGLLFSQGPAARAASDPGEDQFPIPVSISTVPYTVGVLDKVTVTSSDGSVETYQVSQDGLLNLDDKSYPAAGLTPDQVSSLLHRHLGHVASLTIDEFRSNRVTVLGEVFHQIFTEMSDGPMRVLDAIASANGFTPLANTRRVKLVRENAGRVEVYELDLRAVMKGLKSNQNILLKPGDVITVPRNFL
jgi:protein involved in polysaccharide export with SLBB domain